MRTSTRDLTLVNVAGAAKICAVSPMSIRRWARSGKLPYVTINERGDRRFLVRDLYTAMGLASNGKYGLDQNQTQVAKIALYVRVSGSTGQNSSLKAQEEELRQEALKERPEGTVVGVFKDKASGLNQMRPGLTRLLKGAKCQDFDVVYVTHADRLARFGVKYLEELLSSYGVELVVLHPEAEMNSQEELVQDFVSLVACFSGRIYGQRSAENKRRLLSQVAAGKVDDPAVEDAPHGAQTTEKGGFSCMD